MAAAKRTKGAEVHYSGEITARICAELAAGESVAAVCRQAWAPDEKTHYRWMAAHAEYREAVVAAKATGIERHAGEIIRIADESRIGVKVKETKDGTFKEKGDMVDRSRLQIDARKWILAKLLPKKYGDKVEHEHSGGVTVEVVRFAGEQGKAAS